MRSFYIMFLVYRFPAISNFISLEINVLNCKKLLYEESIVPSSLLHILIEN